jgi:hypothetical protein
MTVMKAEDEQEIVLEASGWDHVYIAEPAKSKVGFAGRHRKFIATFELTQSNRFFIACASMPSRATNLKFSLCP